MPDPDCQYFVSWEQETKGYFASRECVFLDDLELVCDAPKAEHKGKPCPWFDPPMFKVGDMVRWVSQANAYWKVKTGEVVVIVPAGKIPDQIGFPHRYIIMFDGWGKRNKESYLVEVPGRSDKTMSKLYWPHVSQLYQATDAN